MASWMVAKTLKTLNPSALRTLSSAGRRFSVAAAAGDPESDQSSFTFSSEDPKPVEGDDKIYVKGRKQSSDSVSMPMSFMTGSIVGKRFYKEVTTRQADDGNGWSVMLDYRTLKTPSKRNLKCPTLALAKAIAAEWEYQVHSSLYLVLQF